MLNNLRNFVRIHAGFSSDDMKVAVPVVSQYEASNMITTAPVEEDDDDDDW